MAEQVAKYKRWQELQLAEKALETVGEDGALRWMEDNVPASGVASQDIRSALATAWRARHRRANPGLLPWKQPRSPWDAPPVSPPWKRDPPPTDPVTGVRRPWDRPATDPVPVVLSDGETIDQIGDTLPPDAWVEILDRVAPSETVHGVYKILHERASAPKGLRQNI